MDKAPCGQPVEQGPGLRPGGGGERERAGNWGVRWDPGSALLQELDAHSRVRGVCPWGSRPSPLDSPQCGAQGWPSTEKPHPTSFAFTPIQPFCPDRTEGQGGGENASARTVCLRGFSKCLVRRKCEVGTPRLSQKSAGSGR